MGHSAVVLGCTLIVHGGINGVENVVIADDAKEQQEFALFDFQVCAWIKIKQAVNETEDGSLKEPQLTIGPLAYHSMTAVYETSLSRGDSYHSRVMWVRPPQELLPKEKGVTQAIKHQGIYFFGGYNRQRECASNTLFVLRPAYAQNRK